MTVLNGSTIEDPDADLIERCQAGDRDAFGGIVKRYAGAARAAAVMLLGSHEDAQDASQEAFVRAWRHLRRFDSRARFYPWYSAILRNVCISQLRRRRHETEELSESHGSDDSEAVLLAESNERRDRVWRAVLKLSQPHREIIVLSHFQDMTYKQIAESLSVPIGTVMSRLYNARQALRTELAGEEL